MDTAVNEIAPVGMIGCRLSANDRALRDLAADQAARLQAAVMRGKGMGT